MNDRDKTHFPDLTESGRKATTPVSDAVKAELLRRRATLEQDRKTARPWSEIYADQLRKLRGPR